MTVIAQPESLYPKFMINEHQVYEDQKRLYRMLLNSRWGYPSSILPEIKDVIFNEPATIVFWSDGTKTVVKCQDDDIYDPEKGLTMAISKKALGNKGNYCNVIKKWTEKYEGWQFPGVTCEEYGNTIKEACAAIREHLFGSKKEETNEK